MNLEPRIASRHVFESRILIHFRRDGVNFAVQGWTRDLSETGLGAFIAEALTVGELVTLEIPLLAAGRKEIPAQVSVRLGTRYGFQFTALSTEQRIDIQTALKVQPVIPYTAVTY